jgi:hypothetical protein
MAVVLPTLQQILLRFSQRAILIVPTDPSLLMFAILRRPVAPWALCVANLTRKKQFWFYMVNTYKYGKHIKDRIQCKQSATLLTSPKHGTIRADLVTGRSARIRLV